MIAPSELIRYPKLARVLLAVLVTMLIMKECLRVSSVLLVNSVSRRAVPVALVLLVTSLAALDKPNAVPA
jgi:hypothetical protein